MAKLSFTKLNKIKGLDPIIIPFGENTIEVEQYLPLEDKVNLISSIIDQAGNGEEGFFNIVKLEAYYVIEMVKAYTNISFTEKQLEDTPKLYDALRLNNIWDVVCEAIPAEERDYIWDNVLALAREITNYNNSILGVLKTVSQDYSALDLDASVIQQKLADPQNLELLRGVLTKMG